MHVLLLSRYGRLGASSRVRYLQYLPFLEKQGWQVDVRPLFSSCYVKALYGGEPRIRELLGGYWRRFKSLLHARQYDLLWIEKEILPFMPAFVERLLVKTGVRYVVDYDDALFHRYDQHRFWPVRALLGRKIDAVMLHAAVVVAGNDYIGQRALGAGAKRVEIVPTVVDLERYPILQKHSNGPLVVGWIGTPGTSRYLAPLFSVFAELKQDFDVRFVAVGASDDSMKATPLEVWLWTEDSEVQSIQDFDIGIMPLPDSPWERGKCGYKLIQYMACGKPVVASPVGINSRIVEDGVNGLLALEPERWREALAALLSDQDKRTKMGMNARVRVETWYSLQVQAPRLASMMCEALR